MHRLRAFASLVLLGSCVGCDRATKSLATEHLAGEAAREYLGGSFRLLYAENEGAFLGLGSSWPDGLRVTVLIGLTAAVLAWAAWALWRSLASDAPKTRRVDLERLGLTLLLAGGVGNLVDRVRAGYVVDFMNLGVGSVRTGIFNVADVALMIGVAALLLASGLPRGDRSEPEAAV